MWGNVKQKRVKKTTASQFIDRCTARRQRLCDSILDANEAYTLHMHLHTNAYMQNSLFKHVELFLA